MDIHDVRISKPHGDAMSTAVGLARSLEHKERARLIGVDLPDGETALSYSRKTLARKLRIGVGTLENLIRDRVKRVDAVIRDRLQALVIQELEQEIARLTHELEMARQSGSHLASIDVGEIETYLARAKALLSGEPK